MAKYALDRRHSLSYYVMSASIPTLSFFFFLPLSLTHQTTFGQSVQQYYVQSGRLDEIQLTPAN